MRFLRDIPKRELFDFELELGPHPYEVYSRRDSECPYPWATWWLAREPGMDEVLEEAGDSLEKVLERLSPVKIREKPTIFLARYEIIRYGKAFRHPEGVPKGAVNPCGFVHFMIGVPFGVVDAMGVIGEYTTDLDSLKVNRAAGPVPKPPERLFTLTGANKVVFRAMWLPQEAQIGQGLEPRAENHIWLYVSLGNERWPLPGEFVGLIVRLMPDAPWGHQETNPFLYSGNWLDTVYYTSGVIKDVNPEGPRYLVLRQGKRVWARPTDYAEYKVGDRVTILKNVGTTKESQTWEDKEDFGEDWFIAPITFYGGK